jgi:hypothetical protein
MTRTKIVFSATITLVCLPSVCLGQALPNAAPSGGWKKVPSITVVSAADDGRMSAVSEAIRYWNEEFLNLGSSFRLGRVTYVNRVVPADDLRRLGRLVESKLALNEFRRLVNPRSGQIDLPESVRQLNGDVIVALSDGVFKSYTYVPTPAMKILVAIRRFEVAASSGAANVIAHEFGHVIGLGHNKDAVSLMCGTGVPWCHSTYPVDGFLPLTSDEKRKLLEMYPPDWGASHPWKGDQPRSLTTG